MPIMHAASVNLNEMPAHTAFALTVAGGAYEREGQSFSNEMLVEKRVFLVRGELQPLFWFSSVNRAPCAREN